MRVFFLSIAISSELSIHKVKNYYVAIRSSPLALRIEIYTASRGFLATARLLYLLEQSTDSGSTCMSYDCDAPVEESVVDDKERFVWMKCLKNTLVSIFF